MEPHLTATACRLPYEIGMLPYTRHKWTHPALTPTRQACTRFTYPGGIEGWVDPGDWFVYTVYVHYSVMRSLHSLLCCLCSFVFRSQSIIMEIIEWWFTRPQTVTHPSTNLAAHGRESNSQPVHVGFPITLLFNFWNGIIPICRSIFIHRTVLETALSCV